MSDFDRFTIIGIALIGVIVIFHFFYPHYTLISVILGLVFVVLIRILIYFHRKELKDLKIQKHKLVADISRCEYLIENQFLRYIKAEDLNNMLLNVCEKYLQDKALPENFLKFICRDSNHYEMFKKVLVGEISKLASCLTSGDFSKMPHEKINGIILNQKKLNDLLGELIKENEKKNRSSNFAEALNNSYERVPSRRGGIVEEG